MWKFWQKTGSRQGEVGLGGILERLARVESKMETVDYEWADWYDKFRRLHARIAKRQIREDKEEDEHSPGGEDELDLDEMIRRGELSIDSSQRRHTREG